MVISLPKDLEAFINAEIAHGHASSADDVIAEALRSYREEIEILRDLVQPALDSLDRGEGRPAEAVFADLERRYGVPDAEMK